METTAIFTAEITFILKDAKNVSDSSELDALVAKEIKDYLDADDVVVTKIQLFSSEA